MQRPSGAAWAALGRDSVQHLRTNSNPYSATTSPVQYSAPILPPPDQHYDSGEQNQQSGASSSLMDNSRSSPATLATSSLGRVGSGVGHGALNGSAWALPSAASLQAGHRRSHSSGAAAALLSNSHATHSNNNTNATASPASLNSPQMSGAFPAPGAPVWRKALYEKQPFEDNYVDAAFMQQLRTNTHLTSLKFRDIMRSTFAVLQQLNLVVLFIVVYVASLKGIVSAPGLVGIDVTLMLVAMVGYVALTNHQGVTLSTVTEPVRKTILVASALVVLSPVFHTLTRSYSDDTIWALSILLGFVHIVFADYQYLNAQSTHFTHNVSMNAAIVAVVLLASRVTHTMASAGVIGIGILFFTLSPILRHHIRRVSVDAHELSAFLLCGIAIGCLMQFHLIATCVFVAVVVLLVALMPLFFVRVHTGRYKVQIQGPWDEAKPVNCAAAAEWANAGLLS